MQRRALAVVFALAAAAVVSAQAPKGWKIRIDRSASASDPDDAGAIKFTEMGGAFRALNPQAAVYWNPANTVSGDYTLRGTFTLMQPSPHVNYYGLVFGGSDLGGAAQKYVYFMVAQDGTWLIKFRNGPATQELSAKTTSDAVKTPDGSGTSTNTLEVRVRGDRVEYVVNGTTVQMSPKSGRMARTDGIYGIRVNHLLNVEIKGLAVTRP